MSVLVFSNSFNFNFLILQQIYIPNLIPLFPIFLLFFISILAETNRPPFDLPEAESELIAGYIVEYGGMAFAAIYLAEYGFIQAMCSFASLLFWGAPGTLSGTLFTVFLIFTFIWVRSALPRIRYDQLMALGWTKILPFFYKLSSFPFFSSTYSSITITIIKSTCSLIGLSDKLKIYR